MTPEKMKNRPPATNILESRGFWNIILIGIMLGGFFLQNASFRTHVTDYEATSRAEILELKAKDEKFEERLRPVETSIAEVKTEVKGIHDDLRKIDGKIDRLLEKR